MTPPHAPDPPPRAKAAPLVVRTSEAGLRADRFLGDRWPSLSRRELARLLEADTPWLERAETPNVPLCKGLTLRAGDRLHLSPRLLAILEGAASAHAGGPPLAVPVPGVQLVHEDALLLVLSKPAGVPTHPLRPEETGTLANHLATLHPLPVDLGGPPLEAGIVHRLDTLTSGLLVAARTPAAYASLRRQFREHLVDKTYLALVTGSPPDSLCVEVPIESRRGRRKVSLGRGQPALTLVTVLDRYAGLALVEARTRFGRRHQVRAHLAHAGYPLLGDPLYAPPRQGPESEDPWPLLHASHLRFAHPADGRPFSLSLPLPDEMQAALGRLPSGQP